MHKILVLISDERGGTVSDPRAAILFVDSVEHKGAQFFVQSHELVTELQNSPEAIAGTARLAVDMVHSGTKFRTVFYMLKAGADYVGLPTVPEICVSQVAVGDTTGCGYMLSIFLEAGTSGVVKVCCSFTHQVHLG